MEHRTLSTKAALLQATRETSTGELSVSSDPNLDVKQIAVSLEANCDIPEVLSSTEKKVKERPSSIRVSLLDQSPPSLHASHEATNKNSCSVPHQRSKGHNNAVKRKRIQSMPRSISITPKLLVFDSESDNNISIDGRRFLILRTLRRIPVNGNFSVCDKKRSRRDFESTPRNTETRNVRRKLNFD